MCCICPTNYRDVDDQGLQGLRLAHLSLDSGKAHYQQRNSGHHHNTNKAGPYAEREHRSYGSRDAVGDVDYHRPYPSAAYGSSSNSNGYYSTGRQGPAPPHGSSGSYDRPAAAVPTTTNNNSSYEPPAGPHASQNRGGGFAADGLLPERPGAYVGPPVQGSGYGGGGYGAGAGHSYAPPPINNPHHAYGPPSSYGAVPQPPPFAGPPEAAAPPGGYGGPAGGVYSMAPPVYGMHPPPPPPPRQPAAPQLAGVGGAHAYVPVNIAMPGVSAGPPAAVLPLPQPPVQQPGNMRATVQSAINVPNTAAIGAGGVATPFAAVPEPVADRTAAAAAEAPEVPTAPKNEFAERLAQRAMASAARAKSSLLAGAGSGSLSSTGSLSRGDSLGGAAAAPAAPSGASAGRPPVAVRGVAVPAGAPATDSCGSSPTEQGGGVFVKPSHPFGRPKLALKPRSALLELAPASGSYSSTSSSDSGEAPAPESGSAASSVSGGRPRLNLLPRGASNSASGSATTAASRKPSVFGEAKPREEVLKNRGLDPSLVDAAAASRQVSLSSRGSGDEEWHTVHRGRAVAAHREERVVRDDDVFNPFFGGSSNPGYRRVMPLAM